VPEECRSRATLLAALGEPYISRLGSVRLFSQLPLAARRSQVAFGELRKPQAGPEEARAAYRDAVPLSAPLGQGLVDPIAEAAVSRDRAPDLGRLTAQDQPAPAAHPATPTKPRYGGVVPGRPGLQSATSTFEGEMER
jgi:hypothetical protein